MSSTEKVLLTEGSLEDIADAIREKNGTETTYKPREMAPAIRALNTDTDWGEIGGTLSDQTDLQNALDGKVDKVTGKQLSTEDYTSAEKTKLGALPDSATLNADLASKQDASTAVRSVNGNLPTNGEVTLNAEDIPADGIGDKSVSGNPITIEDGMASVAKGLSVTLEPIQDLHGYESPWIGTDVDKQPYLFRAVSESSVQDKGTHELDKLVGGTVAWNQLAESSPFGTSTESGITYTKTDNYTWTLSGTASGVNSKSFISQTVFIIDHKYLIDWQNNLGGKLGCRVSNALSTDLSATAKVFTAVSGTGNAQFYHVGDLSITGSVVIKPMLFDLTQMFGSTIADYIYSLEQATAGAGVAWFKKLFPNDYYAYNAGELISVKTSAHVMRDANNNIIGNYALDSDLELRGIPKLDSNNKLYYDGDIYEASGNVQRKYGIVDLGTLNWNDQGNSKFTPSTNIGAKLITDTSVVASIICPKYTTISQAQLGGADKVVTGLNWGTGVMIVDTSYTSAADFKTAMSGVYLVYELATPTSETADPYTSSQVIDTDGTEEYVDSRTVAIPVGHESNYANICSIEGRTGTEVQRTGKNLCPSLINGDVPSVTTRGVTMTISNSKFIFNGTATGNGGRNAFRTPYITLNAGNYYVYADNLERLSAVVQDSISAIKSANGSFTLTEPTEVSIGFNIGEGITYSNYETGAMIVSGSEAPTSWEPYSKDTASISFGQTVYGCTHDFVSGKCRVTHGFDSFVFENVNTTDGWDSITMHLSKTTTGSGSSTGKKCNWTSEYAWSGAAYNKTHFFLEGELGSIYVPENTMRGETIQVVYPLATPTELTLTPAQLSLLEGTNILTADGTINLTYLGSMAANVQDEITEFENGLNNVIASIAFIENSTAKTSHAVGDYVILNGIFCKVIAGISAGETLSFGTNIQATTIGAELKAIWAEISA